jgi:hypothetical protein
VCLWFCLKSIHLDLCCSYCITWVLSQFTLRSSESSVLSLTVFPVKLSDLQCEYSSFMFCKHHWSCFSCLGSCQTKDVRQVIHCVHRHKCLYWHSCTVHGVFLRNLSPWIHAVRHANVCPARHTRRLPQYIGFGSGSKSLRKIDDLQVVEKLQYRMQQTLIFTAALLTIDLRPCILNTVKCCRFVDHKYIGSFLLYTYETLQRKVSGACIAQQIAQLWSWCLILDLFWSLFAASVFW